MISFFLSINSRPNRKAKIFHTGQTFNCKQPESDSIFTPTSHFCPTSHWLEWLWNRSAEYLPIRTHRSLICLLGTARSPIHSRAHGKENSVYEITASISYHFNPLCTFIFPGIFFVIILSMNVVFSTFSADRNFLRLRFCHFRKINQSIYQSIRNKLFKTFLYCRSEKEWTRVKKNEKEWKRVN